MNPSLPSRIARQLYDRQVPRLLAELVAPDQALVGALGFPVAVTTGPRPPAQVAYPTYRRDIQIGDIPGSGHIVTHISEPRDPRLGRGWTQNR